jgi:Protein phosphatase 2C
MADDFDARNIDRFRWVGSAAMYLDEPDVTACGRMVIGRYGGNRREGADKNEDGALAWCARDGRWELALLLDAHVSAESAALVLEAVSSVQGAADLLAILEGPLGQLPHELEAHFVSLFGSPSFRARCQQISGEASCLICVRRERFLWWMSVGDCLLYVLHPELERWGQIALNQRSFYEWIGQRNTFDLAVPCYATGTRELLAGQSRIVMSTDGLFECGPPGWHPFEQPTSVYRHFMEHPGMGLDRAVEAALERVHAVGGRDSATLIAWDYERPSTWR